MRRVWAVPALAVTCATAVVWLLWAAGTPEGPAARSGSGSAEVASHRAPGSRPTPSRGGHDGRAPSGVLARGGGVTNDGPDRVRRLLAECIASTWSPFSSPPFKLLEALAAEDASALLALLPQTTDPKARELLLYALGASRDQAAFEALAAEMSAADPQLRRVAAWALGHTRHPDAVPILFQAACNDAAPEVRKAAITGLGRNGQPGAREALIALARFEGTPPDVRGDLYWAIGKLKDPQAMAFLVSALAIETDGLPRQNILSQLRLRGGPVAAGALPTLERMAVDPSIPGSRFSILGAIAKLTPPREALEIFQGMLASAPTNAIRRDVLSAISDLSLVEAKEIVYAEVESSVDADSFAFGLMLLGAGPSSVVERTRRILDRGLYESKDPLVRGAAITQMFLIGLFPSPGEVRALQGDPVEEVRAKALQIQAIQTRGGNTAELHRALREDASPRVRLVAADTLANIAYYFGAEIAEATLLRVAREDPSPEVREMATHGLKMARDYHPDNARRDFGFSVSQGSE